MKKAGEEIQFTLKGYNGRVVLEWLTHCLGDAATSPELYPDPRMGLTYAAMMLGCILCPMMFQESYPTLLGIVLPKHQWNVTSQEPPVDLFWLDGAGTSLLVAWMHFPNLGSCKLV